MSLKYCPVNDAQCLMDCGDICQQRGGTQDAGEYSDGFKAGREAGMREAADICKRRANWILSRQDGQPHELSNVIVRHHASAHISAQEEILSAIGGDK